MKKLLIISNMYPSKEHLSFGIFVKNQVEALRKSGVDVLVAANDNPATGKKNTIMKYGKWAIRTLWTALRHRKSISVTHAHYVFPSGVFSLLLKKLFRIPYIVTAHGGDIERMAKKNARIHSWTELILQESDHVIAVGPVLAQQIESDFHIPKEKITVCSMGVNRDVFRPGDKSSARTALGLDQDAFTYLFVGNVIRQKGVEELLMAFEKVQAEADRRVKLVIIGSRRDAKFIESIQTFVDEDVQFVDPQPQPQLVKWFQASDVFVLPSHLEGFGLVALEAIASGTPVIASRTGGLVSLLGDGAGHLVEPNNVPDLAAEMMNALHTPKTAYSNQQAADAILFEHDEQEITKRVLALYDTAGKGGAAR